MLAKADPQQLHLSPTEIPSRRGSSVLAQKVWLPGLIYDSLPYFYLTAGFAAFFATLYISDWFWVLPHYLLFSAACLHFSFVLLDRRRKRLRKDDSGGDSGKA